MTTSNKQPLDKTLTLEFKARIADLMNRRPLKEGNIAVRVGRNTPLQDGDVVVDSLHPFQIGPVTSAVLIQAFEPIILTIVSPQGTITEMPCAGLFIFFGALTSVSVKAATPTRISYTMC